MLDEQYEKYQSINIDHRYPPLFYLTGQSTPYYYIALETTSELPAEERVKIKIWFGTSFFPHNLTLSTCAFVVESNTNYSVLYLPR